MVVSLTIVSILMLAMGSSILLVTRALPDGGASENPGVAQPRCARPMASSGVSDVSDALGGCPLSVSVARFTQFTRTTSRARVGS
jgi:hypothetical protein